MPIKNEERGQFKKGQSGNPKGRPKKLPQLDEIMSNVLGDEKDGITLMQGIIMALANKALKGDVNSAKLIFEYGYGRPSDTSIQYVTPILPPVTIEYKASG